MNILQILPALDLGGVERGTVDFARYLTLNGHKSVVVSGGGKLMCRLDEVGSRHYLLPAGKKSPFTIILAINRMCGIIRKENIDIVHARSRVPAIIGFIAAKITHRTFITTAHGYYNTHLPGRAISWGRFVIVAGRDMARHMIEDFGIPRERIRLIPRGVDLNEFKFVKKDILKSESAEVKKTNFVIGIISRITPLKGHTDFLRAAAIIARKVPGLKVLIIGKAPPSKAKYMEELQLLARRLGISNIVDFMGSREDIAALLPQFDVLVLSTRTPEAFGRVIIEAHAVGVPVVATRVGGVVDIIRDGENGLLTFPEDPHSVAEAVLRLFGDKHLICSLTQKARDKVEEKYSLKLMAEKTLQVYEEALNLKKILVIKISALGDVILSIPSLKALRKKFPGAVIKVLTGLPSADVFRGCPYINESIIYGRESKGSRIKGFTKLASRLRREDFDIVVDLQNSRKSHLLSFLSMAGFRYGYDNGKWGFLLNKRVKDTQGALGPVSHQFRTLKFLGIEKNGETLELWPSKEDENWADNFLGENWIIDKRAMVGINLGASGRWQSKKWKAEYIAQLCDELAKRHNIRVLLTGIDRDMETAREITRQSSSKPIISAGKTDILRLASLIKRCRVYVTTDSAPMHIAAGMGVPFVALFGPTDPKRHVPEVENYTVLTGSVKCSPCYKPSCGGKISRCMKSIKVEEVLAAVEGFLYIK
ncbi:MAG: lipopolysaccharide heptosyltransferase II, partial [Candidatus Omnitrophota bacterium]|nr:lipopolysaccharide heptosyltransferase II [Candidatus Omnitrophota bacterium]